MSQSIETARRLVENGFLVLPLVPGQKVPAVRGGCHAAAATVAPWEQNPDFGIGLKTGPYPNRDQLVVIDVDPGAGDFVVEWLKTKIEPTVITPRGGLHFYTTVPADAPTIRCSAGRLAPCVDVRGQGGFVAVPPSRTEHGVYQWVAGTVPTWESIPQCPAEVLKVLINGTALFEESVDSPADDSPPESTDQPALTAGGISHLAAALAVEDGLNPAELPLRQGQRNQTLVRVFGSLIRRHKNIQLAAELLRLRNREFCQPPLEDAELETIIKSISGSETRKRQQKAKQLRTSDGVKIGATEWVCRRVASEFAPQGAGEPPRLLYLRDRQLWTRFDAQRGWEFLTDAELESLLQTRILDALAAARSLGADSTWSDSLATNVVRFLERAYGITVELPAIWTPDGWVSASLNDRPVVGVLNGNLVPDDNGAWTLQPVDIKQLQPYRLPVTFDPNAGLDRPWLDLVDFLLADCSQDQREAFMQFVASMLMPCRVERFVTISGTGANGKSSLAASLLALLGNNATVSPLPVAGDRFSLAPLVGRLAWIAEEEPNLATADVSKIKAVVSSAQTVVERKFRDAAPVRLFCRLLICTNESGIWSDTSLGLFRRAITIEVNRVIPEHMRNPRFLDIRHWQASNSARLNTLLPYLYRIWKAGWNISWSGVTVVTPLDAFVAEKLVQWPGQRVYKKTLYQAYRDWAESNGHRPLNSPRFFMGLKSAAMRAGLHVAEHQNRTHGRFFEDIALVDYAGGPPPEPTSPTPVPVPPPTLGEAKQGLL